MTERERWEMLLKRINGNIGAIEFILDKEKDANVRKKFIQDLAELDQLRIEAQETLEKLPI